jgi:hypothetical protein
MLSWMGGLCGCLNVRTRLSVASRRAFHFNPNPNRNRNHNRNPNPSNQKHFPRNGRFFQFEGTAASRSSG